MNLKKKIIMKKEIKELRVQIDGLTQLTEKLKPVNIFKENENVVGAVFKKVCINSDEITEAVKSLKLAKAWLGKILGELGEDTPYANDGNRKTVEDIEHTADKPNMMGVFENSVVDGKRWDTKPHIEKVDWLREEIKSVAEKVQQLHHTYYEESRDGTHDSNKIIRSFNTVDTYLSEARFWLGFELGRIKTETIN